MGFGEWFGNKVADGSEILGGWIYDGLEYAGWVDDVLASETFNRLADIGDKQITQLRDGHVLRATVTGLTGSAVEGGRLVVDGVSYVASEANEGVKEALGVESWTGLAKDSFAVASEWTSEKAGQVADYVGEKVDNILPDFGSWQGWVAMLGGGFLGMAASNMIGGGMMTSLILGGAGVLAGLYIKSKYFSNDEEEQNIVSEAEKTETAEVITGQTASVEGVSLDDTKVLSNGPAVSAFSGENVEQAQEQTEDADTNLGTQDIESDNKVSYLYPPVQSSLNKMAA